MIVRRLALVVVATLASGAAYAVQPDEVLSDPRLEARARDISAGLRCLVCQNESIDDSRADLARDLRLLVRERIEAGDDDGQVRNFLVRRYGNFVLLKPPLEPGTALLWATPFVVLIAGATALTLMRSRSGELTTPAPLSQVERDHLAAVIDADLPPKRFQ